MYTDADTIITTLLGSTDRILYPCNNSKHCACFNESSDIGIQCGCLPGYKAKKMKNGASVCVGKFLKLFFFCCFLYISS